MTDVVHICLLSDFPSPNVCPLLDHRLRAHRAVFVFGEEQGHRLAWLRRVLDRREIEVAELRLDNPWDEVEDIRAVIGAEIARQREQGAEVLVNVTGGTRPMAIAAHLAAVDQAVPSFHVHDDTVAWLHLPPEPGHGEIDLEERLKLPAFLLTYGIRVTDSGEPPLPPGADSIATALLEDPGRHVHGIRALNYHASKAERSLRVRMDEGNRRLKPLQDVLALFQRNGLLHIDGAEIRFDNEAARFFCAGGWLERATFDSIRSQAPELGSRLNDCRISLEVEYLEAGEDSPRNEFDVVALYDNRLHLIECKTRHFEGSDADQLTAALYKLASLRRELGDIRTRAMLVSYLDVEDWHRERARLLEIELVAAAELRQLGPTIRTWLES